MIAAAVFAVLITAISCFVAFGWDLYAAAKADDIVIPFSQLLPDTIELLKNGEVRYIIGIYESLAMANTIAAVEAGATYIDGSMRALGAGAGNTQTEVMVAVLERLGYETGIDLYKLIDTANDVIAPIMQQSQEITGSSLILGYAGVYSSFLLHAQKAAKQFGVDERDLLIKIGQMKAVGGQEDLIYEVAQTLVR